ncbi:MAG: U32 family peptidase [Robiginitomaculum sp.]|nr:U32 family peptidase [Robiginitomaculum sp.]
MKRLELVCPAGTPASLRAAVQAGADTVYCGYADETNARNFPGLNFSRPEMDEAIAFAHDYGAKVLVAINTFPQIGNEDLWHQAVIDAKAANADAVILADPGLLAHTAHNYGDLRLHLSVQAAAANPDVINFYAEEFGVKRVVLPRVLSVAEIAAINREIDTETEVFVFGGLCVMEEGRCSLSSYATGKSPNMNGVCSPASHVVYEQSGSMMTSKLGDFIIDEVEQDAPAPYPTLCKGRFMVANRTGPVFEDPSSLDASSLIPQLAQAGVVALKIEGRQRSRSYVAAVVRSFRKATEACALGQPIPSNVLAQLSEGQGNTTGAYRKAWR